MKPSRWKQVGHIFDAALSEPPEKRLEFLHQACKGDIGLETEIRRLLEADERAGSFLEPSSISRDTVEAPGAACGYSFTAGSLLSGRFEIVRLLGEGGMGQVYEAVDRELNERVALKTIRREISQDSHALARFKKEVYLTRRITHPNVCRTFDLDRHSETTPDGVRTDVVFLTMELLVGETLSDRLKARGRLSTDECLPLAEQISDALGAAHRAGIIHRDLKPSNILLVPGQEKPRVVVTDFGLARSLDPEGAHSVEGLVSSMTGSAQMIGTLAYMAPELLEGEEATRASDIYAFGLILFEMVTGKRPFADENGFSEAVKRLRQPAPPLESYVLQVDLPWASAIARCLESNPSERFRSPEEVLESLRGEAQTSRRRRDPKQAIGGVFRAVSWSAWLKIVAVLLSLMALFFPILRYYERRPDARTKPGAGVLMTQIRNTTGEQRFDGTTALLEQQLSQSAYFNLLEKRRVDEILARMERPSGTTVDPAAAREVALRAGVSRVVFGVLSRVGDGYVLDVEIEQPDNNPKHARARWDNHWGWSGSSSFGENEKSMPADFLHAIRNCSDWVRHEIGESPNDIARLDAPPEDITTGNWDALTEYVASEKFHAGAEYESAIVALENAVKADPGFALGYMRLGDHLMSLRRFDEAYRAYANALKDGQNSRLSQRENYRLQGIYASDAGDFGRAEGAFHNYTTYYSNDYLGWFYRAYPLMMLGRVEEAVSSLKIAVRLNPAGMSSPAHIARYNLILGNFEETGQWTNRLRETGYTEDADIIEAEKRFLLDDYASSEGIFGRLRGSRNLQYRSMAYSFLGRLASELGQYQSALSYLEEGIAGDLESGDFVHRADKLLDRAYISLKRRDYAACLRDTEDALKLDRSFERSMTAASILGQAIAGAEGAVRSQLMSELRKTKDTLPEADFRPISEIARARIQGELLLAEGRWGPALEELRRAAALDSPAIEHEYLARGLRAAARSEKNKSLANQKLEEALAEYGKTVRRPGQIWQWSLDYLPGYLSDETLVGASVAADIGKDDAQVKNEIRRYLKRRKASDGGLGDVEEARRLADFWTQKEVH